MNADQRTVLDILNRNKKELEYLFTNAFDATNDTARRSLARAISQLTNAIAEQGDM